MDSNEMKSSDSSIPIESGEASGSLSLADVPFEHRTSVNKSSTFLAAAATQGGTPPIEEKDVPYKAEEYEENSNMQDVDVENGDAFPSTNVEEIESTSKTSATRRGLMSLFCLVLLGLIIGISVGVSGRKNKHESSAAMKDSSGSTSSTGSGTSTGGSSHSHSSTGPTTDSDGGAAAPPPASAPTPTFSAPTTPARAATVKEVIDFLVQQGVADETTLMNSDTPQYQAVHFLAEEDIANLPVPGSSNRRLTDDDPDTTPYLYLVRYALSVVYFAMNGPNWLTKMNFMSPAPVCNWNGDSLSLDPYSGIGVPQTGGLLCVENVPMMLDLELDQLTGTLPTELGLINTLQFLNLRHNEIQGRIPTELCEMSNLELLMMADNKLRGTIPSCIGQWSNLRALWLDFNELTGTIPQGVDLCNLTKLESFWIQRNNIQGQIPSCVGYWKSLSEFVASVNLLTGKLPEELIVLSTMVNFWVDDNMLEGNPTNMINSWASLEGLYLENNHFSGTINDNFAANLLNLTILDVSTNNFTSTDGVPRHLLEHPTLEILDLGMNDIQGTFPKNIPYNEMLLFLSLNKNKMSGKIPKALTNFTYLLHLDLSENEFTGPIPDSLFEMENMAILFLANNPGLEPGPLPIQLENMTYLYELSLKNTNRTGPLPELIDFTDLVLLDLDGNDLTGTIPASYGDLENLRYLLLNRNPLTGTMPAMSNTPFLQVLLLDGTDVSGNFTDICSLPAFAGRLDIPGNEIIVTDCNNSEAIIGCDCCNCCTRGDGPEDCSDPVVANLDWTWESQFIRSARDFGINQTLLRPAADPPK